MAVYIFLHLCMAWSVALADPGRGLGACSPAPNMWEFFKAKEFMVLANQG